MIPRLSDRRILTYGISPQADIRAVNIHLATDGTRFRRRDHRPRHGADRTIADLLLPMFGEHNVQNSLAAIAIADEMGIGDDVVRAACATSTA